MKISRTTVIGLLTCLTALYLMNELWLRDDTLAILPVLGVYLFPIGMFIVIRDLLKK